MPTLILATPRAEWLAERLAPALPSFELVPSEVLADAEPPFADGEVVVCGSALTRDMVARMPRLRFVQSYISGTDDHVRALADRPDVVLASARGLHGPQMAEMALFHMLFLSRNGHAIARNQRAHVWEKLPQRVLEQRVVGVVGLGVIGEAIARACAALDMTVYGFSRTDRPVEGIARVFERERLAEVAPELDVLVLCVPHSAETEKLVDARVLAALRPTAVLVNLARGPVVDEEALVAALREGRIAGAGLDVFTTEPLPGESPLWDFENVLVTPHLAGFSDRYHEHLLPLLERNLQAYAAGAHDELLNVVAHVRSA